MKRRFESFRLCDFLNRLRLRPCMLILPYTQSRLTNTADCFSYLYAIARYSLFVLSPCHMYRLEVAYREQEMCVLTFLSIGANKYVSVVPIY